MHTFLGISFIHSMIVESTLSTAFSPFSTSLNFPVLLLMDKHVCLQTWIMGHKNCDALNKVHWNPYHHIIYSCSTSDPTHCWYFGHFKPCPRSTFPHSIEDPILIDVLIYVQISHTKGQVPERSNILKGQRFPPK